MMDEKTAEAAVLHWCRTQTTRDGKWCMRTDIYVGPMKYGIATAVGPRAPCAVIDVYRSATAPIYGDTWVDVYRQLQGKVA